MSIERKARAVAPLIITLLSITSLLALSATSLAAEELEQVIVTAGKIEKPINEITHSVTVVSEEQIKEQAFTDITEVLRQQPGVEFKQVGGPGQFNYLKLRGLTANNVLIVVDGVKINTASGGDSRNLLSQLDPGMIESLEIVRGPQATLYGANATAGVIVITTKSGKHPNADIAAEVGSLRWRRYNGSLRDAALLGDGKLSYSANLSATDSDNIFKYEYFKDRSGQAKLSYETQRFAVGASYWKTNNDFGYAELDEAYCCQTKATYWSFQTPDPNQHSKTGQIIGSVFLDFNFTDNLKQKMRVGTTRMNYTIEDRADGLLGYQLAPVTIPAFSTGNTAAVLPGGVVPIYDTTSNVAAFYRDKRDQAEYNLVYTGALFNLLGGLDHEKQAASQWGTYGVSGTSDSQTSLFVSGDLKLLSERLILSLGARGDDYSSWGRQTTGNAGFAWQFTQSFNVYANYGTSFKPATMFQLFSPAYGDPRLKPESGKTAELGVRSKLLDNRLSTELSLWSTHIDDVIFYDYSIYNPRLSTPYGQYNNGSEGKTSGVEFKTDYQLSDAVNLYANYTYTDSQTKAINAPWKRSVQIAFNKINLSASYKLDKLTLGTNVYYSGPRFRWAGDLQTAGYTRVDISGRYQLTKRLALSGRVENVLDRDYLDELGYAETGMYSIFGIDYKFF